jgi:hypothetical protein
MIRKKFGVSAALFALLIQFLASFGHVHSDQPRLHPLQSAFAVDLDGTSVATSSDTDSDGHFADICNVCATLNLVASGQIAAPPALPDQIISCHTEMPALAEIVLAGVRHPNFWSRAPPSA